MEKDPNRSHHATKVAGEGWTRRPPQIYIWYTNTSLNIPYSDQNAPMK